MAETIKTSETQADVAREGAKSSEAGADVTKLQSEIAKLQQEASKREATNETLQAQLNDLQNMLTSPEVIQRMAQGYGAQSTTTNTNDYTEFEKGVDDPAKFAQAVEARAVQKAQAASQPVVQQLTQQVESLRVQLAVSQAAQKFQDFDAHRDTMAKLARQHPTLGVDELYTLAKRPAYVQAETELAEKKKAALASGSSVPGGETASSKMADALKGKTGDDITATLADMLEKGESIVP